MKYSITFKRLRYFRRLEQNPESILSKVFPVHRERCDGLSIELERILRNITNRLMNCRKTAKAGEVAETAEAWEKIRRRARGFWWPCSNIIDLENHGYTRRARSKRITTFQRTIRKKTRCLAFFKPFKPKLLRLHWQSVFSADEEIERSLQSRVDKASQRSICFIEYLSTTRQKLKMCRF